MIGKITILVDFHWAFGDVTTAEKTTTSVHGTSHLHGQVISINKHSFWNCGHINHTQRNQNLLASNQIHSIETALKTKITQQTVILITVYVI